MKELMYTIVASVFAFVATTGFSHITQLAH